MTYLDPDHFYAPKPYGFVEFTTPEEMAEALKGELKPVYAGQHMLEILRAEEWGELEPGAMVLLPQVNVGEATIPGAEPAYFVKENVTPAEVIAMVSKAVAPNSDTAL